MRGLPGYDDEQVETVPGLVQVRSLAEQSHGEHLDAHLDGKEGEDEVVKPLQDPASRCRTRLVEARLVHPKRQTIQQNNSDADSLKPRERQKHRDRESGQGKSHQPRSTVEADLSTNFRGSIALRCIE